MTRLHGRTLTGSAAPRDAKDSAGRMTSASRFVKSGVLLVCMVDATD